MADEGVLGRARALAKAGQRDEAAELIREFACQQLGLQFAQLEVHSDQYSLNSLFGLGTLSESFQGESELFFKFHQEEDESKGVGEYYNSRLLEAEGFPVDVPLASCSEVGNQILFYRVRRDPRLADVCRDIESSGNPNEVAPPKKGSTETEAERIIRLQCEMDQMLGWKYLASLRFESPEEAQEEPIHQLFYHRLVDAPDATEPGGRFQRFYIEGRFEFPGLSVELGWEEIAGLHWEINGRRYAKTLRELFTDATRVLHPSNLPNPCPVIAAHGDAHNANVWVEAERLVMFDPAFAGRHIPALLAEVKATFHNILAHPDWLYFPQELSDHYRGSASISGGVLQVQHNWELTALRRAFLESKIEFVWRPLLAEVFCRDPGLRDSNWQEYIRLALFACPTLVMNLCARPGGHTPTSSLLGLSMAVMCGSKLSGGGLDLITRFLQEIEPE